MAMFNYIIMLMVQILLDHNFPNKTINFKYGIFNLMTVCDSAFVNDLGEKKEINDTLTLSRPGF